MNHRLPALLLALALLVVAPAVAQALTVDDVIQLAEAGVSDDIILAEIARSKEKFQLTAADLARLEDANVSAKVIRAMGGTPSAVKPKPKPKPDPKQGDARKKAEEARAEEQRRKAAEAEQAAAAAAAEKMRREQEAAQLKAAEVKKNEFAGDADLQRLIDGAYDDLDGGRHADAARAFDQVITGRLAAANSATFVDAAYGLAEAYTRLGLPSAAAPYLVEVLRHGPKAPRFDEALALLGRYAASVEYNHPILELLDGFDVSDRGAELRDEHAFLVGGYRARFGDFDRARTRLKDVRADGPRGPAAAYRLGLVEVAAGKPLDGLRAFERTIELAEKRGDREARELRDLAYLALARIAYEVGRFDAAIDYYRRVSPASSSRARARYELTWALLLSGDDAGALAAMEVVGSERYAADLYVPDLGVVEAMVYLDLCQYDLARERAAAFLTEVTPLLGWLEQVVELPAADAYAAALAHPLGRTMVLADIEVHVAASARAALLFEQTRVEASAGDLGDDLVKHRLRPLFGERAQTLADQAATAALRRLRAARLELADLTVNADEVKVEADLAEREELYDDEAAAAGRTGQAGWTRPHAAADESYWDVDDERWLDEEDDTRSFVNSVCPTDPKDPKERK